MKSKITFTFILFILVTTIIALAIIIDKKEIKQNKTIYIHKTDWELLKIAIIWQESKGNSNAIYKNAYGIYQITPIYIRECNNILDTIKYCHNNAFIDSLANDMFEIVQSYHNPTRDVKKAIKMHNPTAKDSYYNSVYNYYLLLKYSQDKN